MSIPEVDKALNKAKIHLMSDANMVFFSTVLLMLDTKWSEATKTLAVDGKCIYINPNFFMGLSPELRAAALLHETLHVALMHITRCGDRNPEKWNYAGDYVINSLLREANYPIQDSWLYDSKYQNLSTGEVYELIPDPPKDFVMDVLPPVNDPTELTADIKEILVRTNTIAQASSNGFANLPGEIQFFLDKLLKPKLPWHQILRSFFNKLSKTDYTFRKPNRRFFPEYILPSQHSETMVDITVAVDTSCSVTDEQFIQFVSETSSIIKNLKPTKLQFIQFDTEIRKVTEIHSMAELGKLGFTGRGGTNISPLMAWTHKEPPEVLIVFTDGYFRTHRGKPGCNVIWIINDNPSFTTPFGKVIHFTLEGDT